jgi:hypothetical protein
MVESSYPVRQVRSPRATFGFTEGYRAPWIEVADALPKFFGRLNAELTHLARFLFGLASRLPEATC